MRFKNVYLAILAAIATGSPFGIQNKAFSSDVYFTRQEVKGHIIQAIEGVSESIDISVQDITSKDILNALVRAKERGVHIRIMADKKRSLKRSGLSDFYKNKAFAIKALNPRERIRSSFAIFDCKLLIIGAYDWNEVVGRLNRDDAVFTEETKLLVKFQKEFDRLFHEGIDHDEPGVSGETEKEETAKAGTAPTGQKAMPSGTKVVASRYGVVITENKDGYLDMNFEEFDDIFGLASGLTEEQKENLWSRCTGKRVQWHGQVISYPSWTLITGWIMGVKNGNIDIEIKLNAANKAHFSPVKYGNTVTYTGKLGSRVTRIFPYKLEDGDVLAIEDTRPAPVNEHELGIDPDGVPVSHDSEKVFLHESFAEIDNIFGIGSTLSSAEKDEAWKKYEGKYIRWEGQIVYKNLNAVSGLRVKVRQKDRGDVEIRLSILQKDKALKFQDGESILYTGRLAKRGEGTSPYILEDGDILTVK
ncbi:MAG: phospholipase D-like domain-containing protein [Candidatus Brocadiaceae bacterium]